MLARDFEDKNFFCQFHPQQLMKFVYLSQECSYKCRFLCYECIFKYQQHEYSNIATIKDFLNDPMMFIKLANLNPNENFFHQEMLNLINEQEIQIKQIFQSLIDQIQLLKKELDWIKKLRSDSYDECLKSFKINLLKKKVQQVFTYEFPILTSEFKDIEKQLEMNISQYCKYFKNLEMCWNIGPSDYYQSILNFRRQFIDQENKIKNNIDLQLKKSQEYDIVNIIESVHNEISKGKFIKYNLLYSGVRDGLNTKCYWDKCDQQSHLLTIISLKNGNIFGTYSPCQIMLKDSEYLMTDDTNSSFIFQQNKQEIYRLKNNQYTIYCIQDNGPTFGSDHDFYINNNFQTLGSNLGQTYDISGYNVQNKNTHLIGDNNTEIIECKVFKVTFL